MGSLERLTKEVNYRQRQTAKTIDRILTAAVFLLAGSGCVPLEPAEQSTQTSFTPQAGESIKQSLPPTATPTLAPDQCRSRSYLYWEKLQSGTELDRQAETACLNLGGRKVKKTSRRRDLEENSHGVYKRVFEVCCR